jgi:antitoxin component YwqK of YwqJK toxin-antitoxin module
MREYYENGTVKTKERSLVETSIFGEMLHRRIMKREYDENGKLTQKIKKNNLEETIFVYQKGKLVSKKTF